MNVKIVPKDLWEKMREFLDDPGVILVPEETYNQMTPEQKAAVDEAVEDFDDEYDFGGEADVWVDIVRSADGYTMEKIMEAHRTNTEDDA